MRFVRLFLLGALLMSVSSLAGDEPFPSKIQGPVTSPTVLEAGKDGSVSVDASKAAVTLTPGTIEFAGKKMAIVVATGSGSPTPPAPEVDPKLDEFKSAFSSDTTDPAKKASLVKAISAVYKELAKDFSDPKADNPKTSGDLFNLLTTQVIKQLQITSELQALRKLIGGILQSVLPSDPDAVLDATVKAKAAEAFKRIAALLDLVTQSK